MAESLFSFSVLDVGQGSMQLIERGDDINITIDCNIAGAPEYAKRYLGRRKVNHINLHIFSGKDQDHADAEGFQMLINKTNGDIREVWYPAFEVDTDKWESILEMIEQLKKAGTVVRSPKAGEFFRLGELTRRVNASATSPS